VREPFILVAHLLTTLAKLMRPGGAREVAAESLMLKHQMLILNRSRKRTPRLTPWDRLLLGVGASLLNPKRIPKIAVGITTSTLLRYHRVLTKLKYHLLFSPQWRGRPGPKGPSKELIAAVLAS
jgi:putative transposase